MTGLRIRGTARRERERVGRGRRRGSEDGRIEECKGLLAREGGKEKDLASPRKKGREYRIILFWVWGPGPNLHLGYTCR